MYYRNVTAQPYRAGEFEASMSGTSFKKSARFQNSPSIFFRRAQPAIQKERPLRLSSYIEITHPGLPQRAGQQVA
jgi:hypothetical protein